MNLKNISWLIKRAMFIRASEKILIEAELERDLKREDELVKQLVCADVSDDPVEIICNFCLCKELEAVRKTIKDNRYIISIWLD